MARNKVFRNEEGRGAARRSRPSKNVAKQIDRTGDRASGQALASALTAVMDSQGMVICVLASRVEARAFLRGGCA